MHPDAEFARLYGAWDPTMTDDQYFGLEEWPRDVRYYNCRSQKAFSNADGERKGEPYLGVKIPRMPALAWKAFDYMKSRHDPGCVTSVESLRIGIKTCRGSLPLC